MTGYEVAAWLFVIAVAVFAVLVVAGSLPTVNY